MKKIIECVPNFSEGKNKEVINKIAESIRAVAGVNLLHIDPGYDANRTVMTFVGEPSAMIEAAFNAIKTASECIDMKNHQGTHPRIGATDVCPIIPIKNVSLDEAKQYAEILAKRVGNELSIPVYMYEASAIKKERQNLATIRKGEYEGLIKKMLDEEWVPDFGPKSFNAKTGATVIGARNFLLAYNVNLKTKEVGIAKKIAEAIRSSNKENQYNLPNLKAIGWYIDEYDCAQVSMNLTSFEVTNMPHAFEACKKEANDHGVEVNGSELIGLLPLRAIIEAGKYYLPTENDEQTLIKSAIENLGLSSLKPFDFEQRVIEYLMKS